MATSFLAVAGLSFLPEFFIEDEWSHKLDEGLLVVLGATAIWWYCKGANRFKRSVVPAALVMLGLVVKILGVLIELKDTADVGDDFGGLTLFVCMTALVLWQYRKGGVSSQT